MQAILATSANGMRALVRRTPRRDLPVFAVGPQTAAEARRCRLHRSRNADGDARALAAGRDALGRPEKGALLHVCGEEAPGTLAENLIVRGFKVRALLLYAIEPATSLPAEARAALESRALDAVLFFSPTQRAHFRAALARWSADGGSDGFLHQPGDRPGAVAAGICPECAVAAQPNQAAMLALLD